MGLFVDTTGADVEIEELGITLIHPATDYDLGTKFSAVEISLAVSLTTAITGGDLAWKKTSGGSVEAAGDYDPDYLHIDQGNTGTGDENDRLVTFKDLLNNGPNGGGPLSFTGPSLMKAGDVLSAGRVTTDDTGQIMKGSNSLTSLSISNKNSISGSAAKVQLRYRTGLNTWALVAGAVIEIPVASYRADAEYDILLPTDAELGAIMTDDSSDARSVVLTVYCRFEGFP